MESQEKTLEDKRALLERFLNEFMVFHQEKNSLIFDNIDIIYKLIYFVYDYWYDFLEEYSFSFDWDKVSKTDFFENMELIEVFYSEIGVKFDFEEIIKNGTLDLTFYDANDIDNEQNDDMSHFIRGNAGKRGNHKYINGYNNGLVTDSIIWVHEITHYRNESDLLGTQERSLLTESISYAMQLIYMNFLLEKGYTYEIQGFKFWELNNLFNALDGCIPLARLYLIFIKYGNISETSYNEFFHDGSYDYVIDRFYNTISENQNEIFPRIEYSFALAISIYMYISYMKDKRFIDKIEQLNNSVNEGMSLEELLNIIGLTGYDSENVDKIHNAFDDFKHELMEFTKQKKH